VLLLRQAATGFLLNAGKPFFSNVGNGSGAGNGRRKYSHYSKNISRGNAISNRKMIISTFAVEQTCRRVERMFLINGIKNHLEGKPLPSSPLHGYNNFDSS
jgi:hypothetical protein